MFQIDVYDRSASYVRSVWNAAQHYYMRHPDEVGGLSNAYAVIDKMGDALSLAYTNVDAAWGVLMRYVDIHFMTEEEKEAYSFTAECLSVDECKAQYKEIRDAVEKFEHDFGHNAALGDKPYTEVMDANLRNFCYYLVAADDRLTKDEADMINEILGENYSFEETLDMASNSNVISDEDRAKFETSIMKSFVITVFADRCYKRGGGNSSYSYRLFSAYEDVGRRILASDGEVSQEEKDDLNKILDHIQKVVQPFMQ